MKELIECLPLDNGEKSQVVKLPWRKYPGIVLQGDSLKTLSDLSRALYERARLTKDQDLLDIAREFQESLGAYLSLYEELTIREGYELPYEIKV